MKIFAFLCILLSLYALPSERLTAETIRAVLAGRLVVDTRKNEAVTMTLKENEAALLDLSGDTRFLRGLEIELTTTQNALAQNTFTMALYRDITEIEDDEAEWENRPLYTENLAGKISTIYQIPFRVNAGLRRTPYASIVPSPVSETSFPILIRVIPAKAHSEEAAHFSLSARPLPGDEGAVKLTIRYPQMLRDQPVSVLIDDAVVDDISAPRFLREGEHQLLVISEYYRTESRRFLVEQGKTTDLIITLKDLTPLLLFETPNRALIYINNRRIDTVDAPYPIEPGIYDIKIQIGDYTIIKTVHVQKGKTYRIVFSMDMSVNETD
jgi:hypothetical protein